MGPTKAIVNGNMLHEAVSSNLIKDGFTSRRELEDYVNFHYLALPVINNAGRLWLLDCMSVYCFRRTQYETVDDQRVHLARCPDRGAGDTQRRVYRRVGLHPVYLLQARV